MALIVLLCIGSCLATAEKSKSSATVSVDGDLTDDSISANTLPKSSASGNDVDASGQASVDLTAGGDSSDVQTNAKGKSKSMSIKNNGVTVEKSQTKAVSKTTGEDGSSSSSNYVQLGSSAGDADTSVAVTSSTDSNSVDKAKEEEMIITFNNGAKAGTSKVKSNEEDDAVEPIVTGDVSSDAISSAEANNGGTAQATANNEAKAEDGASINQNALSDASASGDGTSVNVAVINKATGEDSLSINQDASAAASADGEDNSLDQTASNGATDNTGSGSINQDISEEGSIVGDDNSMNQAGDQKATNNDIDDSALAQVSYLPATIIGDDNLIDQTVVQEAVDNNL